MLAGSINQYRGYVITPEALPVDTEVFARRLEESLAQWRAAGLQLAWLKVPVARSAVVPEAVAQGFLYHHAEPHYVMLTCSLQPEAFVPNQASHYVGAGGVVLNPAGQLLVVSERNRRDLSQPFFKLPGGYLELGEDIAAGVVREVLEETGVQARFKAMCALRHRHGVNNGRSDFYFICLLEPISLEISMQEDEIEECVWMPVEQYLSHPGTSSFNGHIVRTALRGRGFAAETPEPKATYELLSFGDHD